MVCRYPGKWKAFVLSQCSCIAIFLLSLSRSLACYSPSNIEMTAGGAVGLVASGIARLPTCIVRVSDLFDIINRCKFMH